MKTVVNIKVDKAVKEQAKKLAAHFGLSLSAVMNAYLRQFIRDEQLQFSTAPQMSSYLEQLVGPIDTDIKKNRHIIASADTAEELDVFFDQL